ncbi:extracellular solute-binding protein [Paenibacillus sp. VCA1]|uniref:extracellular solute-binding protein n=1 Tax=Paenibacillus sp. VCA1 TaxID=3039148 RepID=UPI0028711680|nr:extracellular solute-binding protein [Paenibacillus sp. VCA1]MDR9853021.1 extracellular solute-binding protein [Paenibacillus sp. VCA1]
MKRKNYWLLFAILLLSLTSLSQAQNLTTDGSRGEEKKTNVWNPQPASPQDTDNKPIRIATHLDESDFKELTGLNEAFVSETGVQVELNNIPDADAYRRLTETLKVGEGPDIMLINTPWIRPLALGGYILPSESYQSSTTGGDVISPISQMLEWNGYQWGVPLDMDPYVLVWRGQGSAPETGDSPHGEKEWKELLAKLESRKDKQAIGLPAGDPYAFAAFMGAFGTANPVNPSAAEMEAMAKLRPSIQFINNKDMQTAWSSLSEGGLTLMSVPYSAAYQAHMEMVELRVPERLYAANPFLLRGRSFAVSSQVEDPGKAAGWIAYMTSDRSQKIWTDATGYLPVRKKAYARDVFQSPPLPLDRLLKPNEGGALDRSLQSGWNDFAAAAKLFLSGKTTEQQYRETMSGHSAEKPAQ